MFCRLAKIGLLLTDSIMLADAISCYLITHFAPSFLHSLPQREYVGICDICGSHDSRTVYRRVIAIDNVWKYVDVTVRVVMRKIFVQFISHGSLDSFDNRAFDIVVPTDLKLYDLAFQQLLKWRVKEFFPLVGSNPDGASLESFQISGSFSTDWKAALKSLRDLDFRGTMCKNFKKTSITVNRYLTPWSCLLRACTSTSSHSNTSFNVIDAVGVSRESLSDRTMESVSILLF